MTLPADVSIDYEDPEPFHLTAQGQELGFYPHGRDRYNRLLEMIGSARETLCIAFYIFACDGTGTAVRDAMTDAARRGVDVTIIVDGYGAAAGADFFQPLVDAGGTYCCFHAKWSRRYLIRNHQKIVIVDGKEAMLGGFNVEDDYFAPPTDNGWNDLAFTVRGSLVDQVGEWFGKLKEWSANSDQQFRAIRRKVRDWDGGEPPVQLLIGGPTRGLSSWARCVSRDLKDGERLDMMMAYFSPPRRLRKRIREIARKGGTRLLMAGKSDNGATIGASRALYRKMLKAGAKIYEFQPCKLHTKLIVLDDAVYLGSANFDMRSLYINLEIVVRIEDAALAEKMREFITLHLPASNEIDEKAYSEMASPLTWARWWASWFLVAFLDYTVSRKLNLGL